MSKTEDIKPAEFPSLSWQPEEIATSVVKLYEYVTNQAERAREWYFRKRSRKRIAGYTFRLCAIIVAVIGAIIPILGGIFEENRVPGINPGWATVALTIAGLLIAVDKLGGFTSGWVRYIRTGQELSQMEEAFRFQWENGKIKRQSSDPTIEQAEEAISQCKTFLLGINEVVRKETDLWAAEFHKALTEIEATKLTH
jgi:hypothetical protein